jgi:hypothetical protein
MKNDVILVKNGGFFKQKLDKQKRSSNQGGKLLFCFVWQKDP